MNHARIILAPDYEAAATAKAIEYFHVEHAHQFRVVVTKLGPLKAKDRLAALSSLRHQLVSDHFHFARLVQPSAPNRRRSVGAPPLSLRLVIWLAQAEKNSARRLQYSASMGVSYRWFRRFNQSRMLTFREFVELGVTA